VTCPFRCPFSLYDVARVAGLREMRRIARGPVLVKPWPDGQEGRPAPVRKLKEGRRKQM
jgi:hypothetical protein